MLPIGEPAARAARLLALAVPAALLGGAYIGEFIFGLYPCEMCWWQRYAHFAALALALLAHVHGSVRPSARTLTALLTSLAGMAILFAGLIGAYHAGVEYGWWQGLTACTSELDLSADPLEAIANGPLIRCDQVQWELLGISLAGFNFLISVPAAALVLALLRRAQRAQP